MIERRVLGLVIRSMAQAVSSGEVATTEVTRIIESGEGGGGSSGGLSISGEDDDKGGIRNDEGRVWSNFGGNRWPRQETLALLKIRSDMEATFRDSPLKGPLWEEVSRKLADLGFNRSAKKCKEKFENVYKYHKRTKGGRTGKSEGKTYRFYDQLEAFQRQPTSVPRLPTAPALVPDQTSGSQVTHQVTVSVITKPAQSILQKNIAAPAVLNPIITPPPYLASQPMMNPSQPAFSSLSFQNIAAHFFSSPTSSSTASDEDFERGRKRKRKWKDFFETLTRAVIKRQEELQKNFLETVEKREHERMVREETWRIKEMARINREHEIWIQERSMATAKGAAVVAFLEKISGQLNSEQTQGNPQPTVQAPPPLPPPPPRPSPAPISSVDNPRSDNGENVPGSSSSRWPKLEVEALITLRTTLDNKYQVNGPKAPLWEEISAGMRKLGYNRSAKRCKEKWENINKYFKKVKESNKKRPDDSKTCTYFHQLDALYKEKNKKDQDPVSKGYPVKPINTIMEPLLLTTHKVHQFPPKNAGEDDGIAIIELQNIEEEEEEDEGEDNDYGDTEEEDTHGEANIPASVVS